MKTSTPWNRDKYGSVISASGEKILVSGFRISMGACSEADDNDNFIFAACNAHDSLVMAIKRLIASDDAHSTIHAPDGDDVARMIEHADAYKNAREVLAKLESA